MSTQESTSSFWVGGEGGRLSVEVLGYENLEPLTESDANWLQARIRLEAGGCATQIDAALTTHDVRRFLKDLESVVATLDGSASLAPEEQAFSLRLHIGKTGRARVSGEFRERGAARVDVGFEFESDQSFLSGALSELRELQRRYPVISAV